VKIASLVNKGKFGNTARKPLPKGDRERTASAFGGEDCGSTKRQTGAWGKKYLFAAGSHLDPSCPSPQRRQKSPANEGRRSSRTAKKEKRSGKETQRRKKNCSYGWKGRNQQDSMFFDRGAKAHQAGRHLHAKDEKGTPYNLGWREVQKELLRH